ncbi:Olfactory receptor 2L5 [Heterocephalus glaber]|uniref:Olfactory receptor 2L5 n=1 Tax=Heterocephalus glaber TaxID=10181 RepID=G5APC0_HETGA|nr:Olfactory receptor 2L5 [Heterocephalus glaber]
MVLLILLDAQLHAPMYFLFSQLSLMDLIYICTTVPKTASGLLFGNKSISFIGCGVQSFFFGALAESTELAPQCGESKYTKVSAEHLSVVQTQVHEYIVFLNMVIFLLFPFMVIVDSYGKVLLAVYCRCSWEGRKKADSTCSTHLTVVTFYIVPFAYTYLHPKSFWSPAEDKVLTVFYTILTPVLNPVIYSLRNKEVLGALRRVTQNLYSENVCKFFPRYVHKWISHE